MNNTSLNNNRQIIKDQWKAIKNKPWVSQALWLIPILWAVKNLWEVLIIGKDSITNREFTTKEQLFKTLSGVFALASRWVAWYNSYYDKDVLETIILISSLQIANRTSYITGVYYSWELQKVLKQHKDNVISQKQKIISSTKKIKDTTQSIIKKHNQGK
jgi:hypothetical protein